MEDLLKFAEAERAESAARLERAQRLLDSPAVLNVLDAPLKGSLEAIAANAEVDFASAVHLLQGVKVRMLNYVVY